MNVDTKFIKCSNCRYSGEGKASCRHTDKHRELVIRRKNFTLKVTQDVIDSILALEKEVLGS